MRKILVLLAGYPATGKSYLAMKIIKACGEFSIVSQDDLKEGYFEKYGYDNLTEKKMLENESWISFYSMMRISMYKGKPILSDYPFSNKQHEKLNELSQTYGYKVMTIRLVGDLEELYKRSKRRDLSSDRHASHLLNHYHSGDKLEKREEADAFLTYDVFVDRCRNKGYGEFKLGKLIEIDVTDYSKVDYQQVIDQIREMMK